MTSLFCNQCFLSPILPAQTVVTSPSRWDHIRDLDEDEKWYERTEVVTKGEHQFHMQCAKVSTAHCIGGPVDHCDTCPKHTQTHRHMTPSFAAFWAVAICKSVDLLYVFMADP